MPLEGTEALQYFRCFEPLVELAELSELHPFARQPELFDGQGRVLLLYGLGGQDDVLHASERFLGIYEIHHVLDEGDHCRSGLRGAYPYGGSEVGPFIVRPLRSHRKDSRF